MQVPQFSLVNQTARIKGELDEAVNQVIDKGSFILGENVRRFEQEVADYLEVKHAIGVGNGSDALFLALQSCGIGPGDEVITTPFTFFATAGSIVRAGAVPVFVDIDPKTFNIDAGRMESKITEKTRAILPVHLYGQVADMGTVMNVANKYKLKVIEDTAQAMGSTYNGQMTCSFGDAGCLSFFPTKNLGCFGDGGMVVTNNSEVAEKLKMLRVHGSRKKYYHEVVGINSRLDELQAAILAVKIKHLNEWITARNNAAGIYSKMLKKSCLEDIVKEPYAIKEGFHTYNQYTVRVPLRDKLQAHLKECGIGTAIYYPLPLHLQPSFCNLGYNPGDFPESERACSEVISLPLFPEITFEQQVYVTDTIKTFYKEMRLI